MEIIQNCSLKKLNTFGIDVKADSLVKFYLENDIYEYLNENIYDEKKTLILGGGSNILFSSDFNGPVLKSEILGIKEIKKNKDFVYLEIGSGVIWDDLVEYCVDRGYGGIENLSLIPGTVGAAPIQNIGAYGVEFEEVFEFLEGIDLISSEKKVFDKIECAFGYRDSIFKREMKNSFLITKVNIKLNLKQSPKISYRAIKDYIKENRIHKFDIRTLREIVVSIRKSKLPDPNKIGNAGSFFKNPIINEEHFIELKSKYKDLVYFDMGKSAYKIPAGWLIEKSGFKGKRIGDVGVHSQQALVLVNFGKGTGTELIDLADKIKAKIFENFNIILDTEVNIV
jgi:UDP-N-acetylmuramate dehydrogenase